MYIVTGHMQTQLDRLKNTSFSLLKSFVHTKLGLQSETFWKHHSHFCVTKSNRVLSVKINSFVFPQLCNANVLSYIYIYVYDICRNKKKKRLISIWPSHRGTHGTEMYHWNQPDHSFVICQLKLLGSHLSYKHCFDCKCSANFKTMYLFYENVLMMCMEIPLLNSLIYDLIYNIQTRLNLVQGDRTM